MIKNSNKRLSLFVTTLNGGGAERMMVRLANEFASAGFETDLVLLDTSGTYRNELTELVNIVDLNVTRVSASFIPLLRYLRRARPEVLLSTLSEANVVAAAVKLLGRLNTRIIVRQACVLRQAEATTFNQRVLRAAIPVFYRYADAVVAISNGVAENLIQVIGLNPKNIHVIYNPAFHPSIIKKAAASNVHRWLNEDIPVLVAAGRLSPQKDFVTLIKAVHIVSQTHDVKLIVLGEGGEREYLEGLIRDLRLEKIISLPGFVDNPFAYIQRAHAMIFSSAYEGFGNVLVEALALGTPVIATDCPSGPREILDNGRYGFLVPVGDVRALAAAICKSLDEPDPDAERLIERAREFSADRIAKQYLDLIGKVNG